MYVSPEYQGQGLNQKVMDKLISWSEERGITNLYLDVLASNAPAVQSYQKQGFEPCIMEMKLMTHKE